MPNHRARKRRPRFFRHFDGTGNEKLVVRNHRQRSTLKIQRPKFGQLDRRGIEMYASSMRRLFVLCIVVAGAILTRGESPSYLVFVSNEHSGDVTVIDGATDEVVATF